MSPCPPSVLSHGRRQGMLCLAMASSLPIVVSASKSVAALVSFAVALVLVFVVFSSIAGLRPFDVALPSTPIRLRCCRPCLCNAGRLRVSRGRLL